MKKQTVLQKNKTMIYSAIISVAVVLIIPIFAKNPTDRFALIMPIFAGWIVFNILSLPKK